MIEVAQVRPGERGFASWLWLATRQWPWAPLVSFVAMARSSSRVAVLIEDGIVVAGALLTASPVNVFLRRRYREVAHRYCENGYANLSYLVVRQSRRGQGHGRELIERIRERDRFWLASAPGLGGFYRESGLDVSGAGEHFFVSR
ncbi:MAG: hypothetical protein JRG91_19825 [Deltaproteobacteria bacterium]|nr:hypothetical protein [Deltaproteobacteria bacterium]